MPPCPATSGAHTVFTHLIRHWLARRHYPLPSWAACIARSLRVLLFHRDHRALLAMPVYRFHVRQVHDDVFHHLSHRHDLARDVPLRERVRCVLTRYRFEDATFDAAYQRAVYRTGGLLPWHHDTGRGRVEIRLGMAQRLNAEGDLTVTLLAEIPSKHRKRASLRRAQWLAVAESARAALRCRMRHAQPSLRTPAARAAALEQPLS